MTLKVSILGVGNMGKNHLRILSMLKSVEVTNIFDVNEDALRELSKQYNVPYTVDADEAIDSAEAVVIVTPTTTHFDYFSKCVGKVQKVFLEKPLAKDLQDAESIRTLAKEHNIYVQCGFIERFNPVVSELKRIVDTEKVINIDLTRTNRLSSRITDVDVVLDLMIHDIDLALHLNGPVKSVVANGKEEAGLVAFASALLKHENGSLSRILASRMTEKKIRSIQVTTDQTYINAELLRKELFVNKQSMVTQEQDQPYTITSVEQQVSVKPQEALLLELQAFVSACSGNIAEGIPTVDCGVEALRVGDLILKEIYSA